MSEHHEPPPSPPPPAPPPYSSMALDPMVMPPNPLYKHNSWSPDACRDEVWHRRKNNSKRQQLKQRSKSVTDEDLDELKACIELGFGFEPPPDEEQEEETEQRRLSDTLPALGLYYAVNRSYKSSTTPTFSFSPTPSECDSPVGSPHTICGPGDNPQTVKVRLKQWAQVVACTVRQSTS